MTEKEAAFLLRTTPTSLRRIIEEGIPLPVTGLIVRLTATKSGTAYIISDEDSNDFISKFEAVEPSRHPPIEVRRALNIEARNRCAICRERVSAFAYHHSLPWAKLKHHDPKHMLAVCNNCHTDCELGKIDKASQETYKAKLLEPVYSPEEADTVETVKRQRDLKTLTRFFSTYPRWSIDELIYEARASYLPEAFVMRFWDSIEGTFYSPNWHLYDTRLHKLVSDFCGAAGYLVSHDEFMRQTTSGKLTFNERDITNPKWHDAIDSFKVNWPKVDSSYRAMYTYVRENYPECDFDVTDKLAVDAHYDVADVDDEEDADDA